MRHKVTVVGSGNVGATAAHWIASKELADVVLIDIIEGVPQGKGLDLLEAMPIEKRDSHILGTNDYADTANSDIVVITAGIPRKPGMSRDDLLNTNHKIMKDVVGKVLQYSPNCILIIVSNLFAIAWVDDRILLRDPVELNTRLRLILKKLFPDQDPYIDHIDVDVSNRRVSARS